MTLSLLLLLVACDGAKDETFVPHCDSTATDVALADPTALGWSAADALAALGNPHTEPVEYRASGLPASEVDISLTAAGTARFVDQESAPVPEGVPVADIEVICDDYLAIDITLDAVSADGHLDQSWTGPLQAWSLELADFSADFDPSTLADPSLIADIDTSSFDTWTLRVSAAFVPDGSTGDLALVGEGTTGDSAFQSSDSFAGWGGE